jgi:hypothetical protein
MELGTSKCHSSDSPYVKAGEFFAALKADARFTSAEVAEIQTRVLNRLTSDNDAAMRPTNNRL